jgi:hypothetical protein
MKISEAFHILKGDAAYGVNMLLGKIIKGSGLKLTEVGVVYEEKLSVENHQSKVGDILIVDRVDDLLRFIELDPERFHKGFKRKEDMFAFVATSTYLKSSEFTDPNRKFSHPIFEDFRDYLTSNEIVTPGKNITFEYVDSLVDFDFFEALEALKQKERNKKEIVTKFNGRVILDLHPAFNKKLISKAIMEFKVSFGTVELYRDFILGNTQDDVMRKFDEIVQF